jgi:ribosomal protein S18 acetylase RimI-like enzyme
VSEAAALGISYRPVRPNDGELLFSIYASTREDEMRLVPWTEDEKQSFLRQQFEAQRTHYRRYLPETEYLVIERNGQPIGRLYLDRRDDELRIVDIALLTEHRGGGIGNAILTDLIDEASGSGVPVRIHVERNNPALGLYRRLGFREIGDQGVYLHMERVTAEAAKNAEVAR